MATKGNPVLTAAATGVADPAGCRQAIIDYGAILGWPTVHVGPLDLKGGEANWRRTLSTAQPLWLGVAWHKIEFLEHAWQLDREDEERERQEQTNKGKEDVTVLQWTDSAAGLEPGDYAAMITEIDETTGEYGPQFQFQFVVLDKEGEQTDAEIRGWCSQKWGEKTKLYKWSQAILGKRCPKPGEPMDTAKLLNKRCDLRVQEKMSNQPGGGMRSSIAEIYPYQTVSKASDEAEDAPF